MWGMDRCNMHKAPNVLHFWRPAGDTAAQVRQREQYDAGMQDAAAEAAEYWAAVAVEAAGGKAVGLVAGTDPRPGKRRA
jgi:hypothetical protein